jgi:AcrR family transcriptional regulator
MMLNAYTTRDEFLRVQILDAARTCVEHKGVDKTRIGDIANELGLARQTIYNYFNNKNELIDAMFLRVTIALSEDIISKIEQHASLEDKFTHLCLLAIKGFPADPVLRQLLLTGSKYLQEFGITNDAVQKFWGHVLAGIFKDYPMLAKQSEEISEMLARNIVSFFIIPDQHSRTDMELESYIRRRIIPSLHLPVD